MGFYANNVSQVGAIATSVVRGTSLFRGEELGSILQTRSRLVSAGMKIRKLSKALNEDGMVYTSSLVNRIKPGG
jgi:hypothetical protein